MFFHMFQNGTIQISLRLHSYFKFISRNQLKVMIGSTDQSTIGFQAGIKPQWGLMVFNSFVSGKYSLNFVTCPMNITNPDTVYKFECKFNAEGIQVSEICFSRVSVYLFWFFYAARESNAFLKTRNRCKLSNQVVALSIQIYNKFTSKTDKHNQRSDYPFLLLISFMSTRNNIIRNSDCINHFR